VGTNGRNPDRRTCGRKGLFDPPCGRLARRLVASGNLEHRAGLALTVTARPPTVTEVGLQIPPVFLVGRADAAGGLVYGELNRSRAPLLHVLHPGPTKSFQNEPLRRLDGRAGVRMAGHHHLVLVSALAGVRVSFLLPAPREITGSECSRRSRAATAVNVLTSAWPFARWPPESPYRGVRGPPSGCSLHPCGFPLAVLLLFGRPPGLRPISARRRHNPFRVVWLDPTAITSFSRSHRWASLSLIHLLWRDTCPDVNEGRPSAAPPGRAALLAIAGHRG
jgi:hypothetical protein